MHHPRALKQGVTFRVKIGSTTTVLHFLGVSGDIFIKLVRIQVALQCFNTLLFLKSLFTYSACLTF